MGKQGFQFENGIKGMSQGNNEMNENSKVKKKDEDLVIEENTIYEIDRECYERLKKQKKNKVQEKRNG